MSDEQVIVASLIRTMFNNIVSIVDSVIVYPSRVVIFRPNK